MGASNPAAQSGASAVAGKQHPSTQMTIFYEGTVNVYDDIPPDKAQAILMLAGGKMQSNCGLMRPPLTKSVPLMNYSHSIPKVSDLQLERKNSLQRFLQKRKERQRAKAPHATQGRAS
ncbi:hypothetical protein SUGI_0126550 [Cryptomeria japonica]|uniref:protein TIFY 3 n=1 Tax=Cryptomeria japonica TaxID=3369 RepID=UPI002408A492|nr:protein TIFY 3 [Cryptomeria japonica]GLJ10344.1 hypothetical protein SUGI_0126550 [Cryptomeria japonica]